MKIYRQNRSTLLFFGQLTLSIMSLGGLLAIVLTLTKYLS